MGEVKSEVENPHRWVEAQGRPVQDVENRHDHFLTVQNPHRLGRASDSTDSFPSAFQSLPKVGLLHGAFERHQDSASYRTLLTEVSIHLTIQVFDPAMNLR